MTIYGSSNVTDWEAKVKTINGEVEVSRPDGADWSNAEASWFKRVEISMPVADIDADSRRMNSNMHDYLKINNHPVITYRMKEALELVVSNNPGAILTAGGILTVGGVSHEFQHDVKISQGSNGRLIISGSKELKMSDFDIKPPTAMLGSIRAYDEMNIEFNLILQEVR